MPNINDDDDHDRPPSWPMVATSIVFWSAVVAICFICAVFWGPVR
jgi:hypothetical protein